MGAPRVSQAVGTVEAAAGGRVPDFFIVGHQKCGTTALYLMLKRHPQVFMPELKEPRFFAPELRSRSEQRRRQSRLPETLEDYLALFAPARPEQRVGEATPTYLRSPSAAARIAEVAPAARIVAILREPADFLRSLHLQGVHNHLETETDLRRALALEGARREGRNIPRRSHSVEALLYSDHVRYVEQLRSFHAAFPEEQVLVLIYDDFRAANEATLRRVLGFLEVDDTPPVETVRTATLPAVRSGPLHQLAYAARVARRNPEAVGPLARALGALTPALKRSDAVRAVWSRVVYTPARPPDGQLVLELRRRFKGEVQALSEYLGRDLVSLWGYDELE